MAARRRGGTIQTEEAVAPAPTLSGVPADGQQQPETVRTQADPNREYVAGGYQPWDLYASLVRALPLPFDDLTLALGDDIYMQMLLHPQVVSTFTTLRAGVLSEGVELTSAIDDKDDPDFDLASQITEECERQLSDLDTAFDDVLWDMQEAMAFGNRVAELVWEDGGRTLRAIKVKPRSATAFVVDAYMNVLGLIALKPGSILGFSGTIALDQLRAKDKPADGTVQLLPREKFAVLSFRPRNGDPRGTSVLRAAYSSWWNAVQIIPEHLRYLSQFASPSLVGEAALNAPNVAQKDASGLPVKDASGKTIMLTGEEVLGARLATFQNGTYIVVPNGGDVRPIAVTGEGQAFLHGFAQWDREIAKAILNQTLATEEGEHQARAAAGVHQDVLGTLFRHGKKGTARMVRSDVLRTWVRYNYGPEAERLTPTVSLGETEQQDQAALLTALGKVGYSLDVSQFPGVDTLASLPPRDPQSVSDAVAARQKLLATPAPTSDQPGQQQGQDGGGMGGQQDQGSMGGAMGGDMGQDGG